MPPPGSLIHQNRPGQIGLKIQKMRGFYTGHHDQKKSPNLFLWQNTTFYEQKLLNWWTVPLKSWYKCIHAQIFLNFVLFSDMITSEQDFSQYSLTFIKALWWKNRHKLFDTISRLTNHTHTRIDTFTFRLGFKTKLLDIKHEFLNLNFWWSSHE